MIETIIKPMEREQYNQLILLGEALGVSVEDILALVNLKNAIEEVKVLEQRVAVLEAQNKALIDSVTSIADMLRTKQDDFFNNIYQNLIDGLNGENEDEE